MNVETYICAESTPVDAVYVSAVRKVSPRRKQVRLSQSNRPILIEIDPSVHDHPLRDDAQAVLDDLVAEMGHEILNMPTLLVRPVEDGSIAIEMRGDGWRLLLSTEVDSSESGWSVVFSPRYARSPEFGGFSELSALSEILASIQPVPRMTDRINRHRRRTKWTDQARGSQVAFTAG